MTGYPRVRRFVPLWASLSLALPCVVGLPVTVLMGDYDALSSLPLTIWLGYMLLAALLNHQTVNLTSEGITITYGSIPFPFRPRSVQIPVRNIQRVYVRHQVTKRTRRASIHSDIAGVEFNGGRWRDLAHFFARGPADREAGQIAKALCWLHPVESLTGDAPIPDPGEARTLVACFGFLFLGVFWSLFVDLALRQ